MLSLATLQFSSAKNVVPTQTDTVVKSVLITEQSSYTKPRDLNIIGVYVY